MTENDPLFLTYTNNWDNSTLNYSKNFPYSFILHPQTGRFANNGVLYGSGDGGPYFIRGNNDINDIPGRWTGTHLNITEYKDGLSIVFVPNIDGASDKVTLNISNLGARDVYFNNTQLLTTQYSIGTPILLTYIVEGNTAYWKRADSDTLDTIIENISTGNDYYLTLTTVSSGKADKLYTTPNVLRYNYASQTLYCPKFYGSFTGNLTGNSSSASKLDHDVSLWGQSTDFNLTNGSTVKGSISNTGNISPETTNIYNIGTPSLKYNQIYASRLIGRADAVKLIKDNTKKIYLVGGVNADFGENGAGALYGKNSLFLDEDSYLHINNIVINTNSNNSNYKLYVNGSTYIADNFNVNDWIKANSSTHMLGVGMNAAMNPSHTLDVNGDGYFKTYVQAAQFKTHNGRANELLVANGDTIEFDNSDTNSTIVQRTSTGDIYGKYFYSNISEENINSIGSVYVATNDNAIRKVSYERFLSIIGASDRPIQISKNLTITAIWMDTGITIDSTTFESGNGSYIVQIDATSINNSTDLYPSIYSGIMTVYVDSTSNNGQETEEIILHRSGKSTSKRLYLRTCPTSNGNMKLQIASSVNMSAQYAIIFKFKKII